MPVSEASEKAELLLLISLFATWEQLWGGGGTKLHCHLFLKRMIKSNSSESWRWGGTCNMMADHAGSS